MSKGSTSLANWDFNTKHVQDELESGGEFLNAASTLIAAGPPRLRMANAGNRGITSDLVGLNTVNSVAYPVGVVESIGVAQNRQLQRLFEIGSKRSYFINGRSVGQINLARTMFHGPSLMRALYAYYPVDKLTSSNNVASLMNTLGRFATNAPDIVGSPGHADFFINLDSDLFDQPFGLMFMLRDASNQPYGAFYLEQAYINGHQFSVTASSALIGEAVAIQYDRCLPIDVQAVTRNDSYADTSDAFHRPL